MEGDAKAQDGGVRGVGVRDVEGAAPPVARVMAGEGELDGLPLYDLRGLNCPLPALKAGRRLGEMAPGGRLWIETTDPLATIDIPALARERGHRLVESREVEGGHRFLVERGPERG